MRGRGGLCVWFVCVVRVCGLQVCGLGGVVEECVVEG